MPRHAHYYSATEAEATTKLLNLCPYRSDALRFTQDDAERLESLLSGNLMTSSCPRNDTNQPLLCLKQSVEHLLPGSSSFSIVNETVHRNKLVHHDSMSEQSTDEWKTRSRTPSSDEPSPRRVRIATPSMSIQAMASSDGSDDGMVHFPKRTSLSQPHSWESFPDHYATYPDNVLQNMDTQFSKWSYDLNEGTSGVPFVMAQAPPDTHESLVKVDRGLWATGDEDADSKAVNSHGIAQAVLERAQKKSSTKPTGAPKPEIRTAASTASREDSASKRAALITKSKAARASTLVTSSSANQRRSAMQRNKNRRSIMPSPPPTARKVELAKKQDAPAEESQATVFIVDRRDEDQRRELDSALDSGKLDFSDDSHMEWLMKRLKSTGADNEEHGRVLEDFEAC